MKSIRRILLFVVLIVPLTGCAADQHPDGPPTGLMEATSHLYEDAPADPSAGAPDSQTRLPIQR